LELLKTPGDAGRGREVFFSKKAACSACHSVRGSGGRLGPALTRVDKVRTRRDLIEAILFPSASFARGYEPYSVTTHDGRDYYGRISRQTPETVVLSSPDRPKLILPRPSIEAIEPGRESLMPRGLEANLTPQEFSDLMVYLGAPK